ncbi:hypothetical protein PAECIP111892_03101 [Paenibacillus auburnensis]|uniref:histidine kinase n=1 Tax=Paenibacillus auburnensis TaxID=2905649 RepID=A0ABM9CD54_9BACL|nr:sensor histidine kinase [Paenibacillus auburnensis]CAH1208391.1 hypothetical protein PAECIP111892_03101 [Paenibacillus auburnensis]
MKKRIFKPFRDLSIRYKMLITILIVFTIPFLLLLTISLRETKKESEKQAVFSAHKVLEETTAYLEYKSKAITEVLNFIALNDTVHTLILTDPNRYKDINLWDSDANKLSDVINQFRYNEDIEKIQLYMKAGLAGQPGNSEFLKLTELEQYKWFPEFSNTNFQISWLSSTVFGSATDSDQIFIIRKIPSANNVQQFDGIVKASVAQDSFDSVLDHAVITPNASAVLFNERDEVISASDSYSLEISKLHDMLKQRLHVSDSDSYWNEEIYINGNRMLLGVKSISNTDMKLAIIVPYSDILSASNKSRDRMIQLFLFVFPLAIPLTYIAVGSMTKRIRRLIAHIRKVRKGDFKVYTSISDSKDEIGELAHNFNLMVQDISELMEETYRLGQEVKNKELMALQAQINPHFLYNTLDLINIMAIENQPGEVSKLVKTLAVFYKLSLSNGEEKVTLESEIRHIEAYAAIQSMRFGQGIQLIFNIPYELYGLEVPKITLQPLVENAIIHGILEKPVVGGTIQIAAEIQESDLILRVEDDGVGMNVEKIKKVRTGFASKNTGGFGIRNIQERIELLYGGNYGLTFQSMHNHGTIVTLRLPQIRQEDL